MLIGGLLMLAVAGQPAYLKCEFKGFEVDVTADEANSAVTLVMPSTGNVEKLAAAFTPEQVRFEDRLMAYSLSRTDLTITRLTPLLHSTDVGTCQVVTPPKRAF